MLSDDIYQKLEARLIKEEGYRKFVYKDSVGIETIGIGRNLTNGISLDEAKYMLRNDINMAYYDVNQMIPIFKDLDEVRQLVLVDMCFNMGIVKLLQFKMFLDALSHGDYQLAAKTMLLSLWAEEVGQRANDLAYLIEKGAV